MHADDWEAWLTAWNRQLLASYDPREYNAFVDSAVTAEVIASGWLDCPGANEQQLAAVEGRLGTPLPPSYRSFLQASNGFLQPGVIVPRLLGTDEVDWFRIAHQETIDAWTLGADASPAGLASGPDTFEHYLPSALQVSAVERVGTAVYLLNPMAVDGEGEWEAFYFAHWVPGVNRYASFRALMHAEREHWTARPPASRPQTNWETLRGIFRA